jgi:K+-sensing histidine kinase KdpD
MFIRVKNEKTGEKIVDPFVKGTTWNYDVRIDDHTYTFFGDDSDKRFFAKFRTQNEHKHILKAILIFFKKQVEQIESKMGQNAVVVNHNFIETCKHVSDPLNVILPDLRGNITHKDKIQRVVNHIQKSDPRDIAAGLLDISRAMTSLHTQISGLEILSGVYSQTLIEHPIYDLIQNLFVPFQKSFEEKDIHFYNEIKIQNGEVSTLLVDYNILNWTFHHLFNNALKYCKSGTSFRLQFYPDDKRLTLEMTSLKVEDHEVDRIFSQQVRGTHAEMHEFSGEGLGMYFIRLSLARLGAKIKFIPNNNTCYFSDSDKKPYCKNVIEMCFPSSLHVS